LGELRGPLLSARLPKTVNMKARFATRDLIWLTLVVALLLAWYLDHRSVASRNRFRLRRSGRLTRSNRNDG
jgi:hypothetical protein